MFYLPKDLSFCSASLVFQAPILETIAKALTSLYVVTQIKIYQ